MSITDRLCNSHCPEAMQWELMCAHFTDKDHRTSAVRMNVPAPGRRQKGRVSSKTEGTSCSRRFGDRGLQKACAGQRTSCPPWGWPRCWQSPAAPTSPPAPASCVPHIHSGALTSNVCTLSGSSSDHSCPTSLLGLMLLHIWMARVIAHLGRLAGEARTLGWRGGAGAHGAAGVALGTFILKTSTS